MLLKINPHNPAPRHIKMVEEVLRKDGIIAYPTDTVYAVGCDLNNKKALEKLARLTGKKLKQDHLSLICSDLSQISDYTVPFDNRIFKVMRRMLPGPVTFILKTNHKVPKLFNNKKKTIGIRIPDHPIPIEIVNALGNPLATASLHSRDEVIKYFTDPEDIYAEYKNSIDMVINGGTGDNKGSTVLDCTGEEMEVIRDSRGIIDIDEQV